MAILIYSLLSLLFSPISPQETILFGPKDCVIGISVHGNLPVRLSECRMRSCSAAGVVLNVDMCFGSQVY